MPESAPHIGLLGYVDGLVGEISRLGPVVLHHGDEEAVHKLRVITRRFTAALQLLKPLLSRNQRRPLARSLKRLRKSLDQLRDLDVLAGHLEALRPSHRDATAQTLAASLRQRRAKAFERLRGAGRIEDELTAMAAWPALREALSSQDHAISLAIVTALHEQSQQFARDAKAVSAELRRPASASAGGSPHPGQPHALRIAGKHLRYTFEIAQAQGLPAPVPVLRAFKDLQDALGDWHDHHVLTQLILREARHLLDQDRIAADVPAHLKLSLCTQQKALDSLARFAELWHSHQRAIRAAISLAGQPTTLPDVPGNPGKHEMRRTKHDNPDAKTGEVPYSGRPRVRTSGVSAARGRPNAGPVPAHKSRPRL